MKEKWEHEEKVEKCRKMKTKLPHPNSSSHWWYTRCEI